MTTITGEMPDAAAFESAAEVLSEIVRVTPVEPSRVLSTPMLGTVRLKCENLQRAGSFKIRGAYYRMVRLPEEERVKGVVAASAGNHAQGVALAAGLLGISATVFMPEGAALPKVAATEGYGATVRFAGHTVDEALAAARDFSESTGATLIHPFDHPDIVAGQGTVGLEILRQVPDVDTIVVGLGGGGLLAGVACVAKLAARAQGREIRVVGVQARQAAAYPGSLAAGRPVALESMSTMADGIAVGLPGAVPFELIRAHVDEIVTVSEDSLSTALLLLLERAKLTVEPAGAASVAALLEQPDLVAGGRPRKSTVAVLSGGNIDPLLLLRVLRHGLSAAGRYLKLQVRVADQPGNLVRLLQVLAQSDANVLDVAHVRTGRALHIDEVEVDLQLETRGAEHQATVLRRLESAGYAVSVDKADRPAV